MNKLSRIIAIVAMLVTVAACHVDRFDARLFSVDVPSGFLPEELDSTISAIDNVQLTAVDDNSTVVIMAFPFEGNPQIVLYNQTLGGANPALAGLDYDKGGLTSFEYGKISGYQISLSGVIEGIDVDGTAYSFNEGGCTFVVCSFSKDKADTSLDSKVIRSIKVNEKAMAEYDSEKRVNGVAELGRLNLPTPVDEVTTWTDIKVDHKNKELVLVMTLEGTPEDYGDVGDSLAALRDGMAANLKANRETDWLILVPSDEDYTLGYDYVTTDGTILGSLRFSPEELK